jgi:hypothetical protein
MKDLYHFYDIACKLVSSTGKGSGIPLATRQDEV